MLAFKSRLLIIFLKYFLIIELIFIESIGYKNLKRQGPDFHNREYSTTHLNREALAGSSYLC
jgi:hypothetical protein